MAKKFYLSFKIRQALNVAQAVVDMIMHDHINRMEQVQEEFGTTCGDMAVQVVSIKEGKNIISFHFERGITIKVFLVSKRPAQARQAWLVKEVWMSFISLRGTLLINNCLREKSLLNLKKTRNWGNPEVAKSLTQGTGI